MLFLTWKVRREGRYIFLHAAVTYCAKNFSMCSLEFSSWQWNCFKFQVNVFNSCFCDTFWLSYGHWSDLKIATVFNHLYKGKPIATCILKSSPHRNFLELLKLKMQHLPRILLWGTSGVIPELLCSNRLLPPLCKEKTTSGESFLEAEGRSVK